MLKTSCEKWIFLKQLRFPLHCWVVSLAVLYPACCEPGGIQSHVGCLAHRTKMRPGRPQLSLLVVGRLVQLAKGWSCVCTVSVLRRSLLHCVIAGSLKGQRVSMEPWNLLGEQIQCCHTGIWVGLAGGSPEFLSCWNGFQFQWQNALVLLGLKS